MSYIVSIRRPPENPISESEIRALVDRDPTLSLDPNASVSGELLIQWRAEPGSESVGFLFSGGSIDTTTTPSNAALRRMQLLAAALGARVFGEEGEDMTEADVPDAEVGAKGAFGCLLAALGLGALAAWWFFMR
ncbi:MAG: hypothetical protein F9K18_05515 [Thermoanaerobaculia bacterium]|nr:MAG: hypothetical protein F9K18_05515 [Thermoanaerobaculia bacterium]